MSSFSIPNREREPEFPTPIPAPRRREHGNSGDGTSRTWLWASILALALALAGAGWYGLSRLDAQEGALSRLSGWPAELNGARSRIDAVEQQLRAIPRDISSVRAELAVLNDDFTRKLAAGLDRSRGSVAELGAALRKEMRSAGIAQQSAIDACFQKLDEERRAETARSAFLERRVSQLDQRLAAVTQDLNHVQNAAALESNRLSREIRKTDDRLTREVNYNQRPRDRFEASKGRSVEIGPGIMLHISRVDPRYRRFSGWLQLIGDGKILWLRDQSMLTSIAFHSGKDALRHDLIVTGLNAYGVSGYLIYPTKRETEPENLVARAGR